MLYNYAHSNIITEILKRDVLSARQGDEMM